jgi:hypothetical protein
VDIETKRKTASELENKSKAEPSEEKDRADKQVAYFEGEVRKLEAKLA